MLILNNYKELYNTKKEIVVFDLETTGLNPKSERIIEIGALKIRDNEIVDRLSMLVNPGIPVPFYSTKVNGITTDMLIGCISDIEGVKQFIEFSKNCIIVAHNISFDIGFINSYLERANTPILENMLVDTVRLARKAFPGEKKYSLGIIASRLNIDVLNAHRAEDDARVCYELYTMCINKLKNTEMI
ncbi:3'-5' exonuclease [Thiospirochaeta perfilievii]|uniref:3'-5' exonuclease n=1 Tax=Thiospirochaeta perfilievii TaxID=252967 RepID=A0A5C1QFT6_9SPIO|nr:3'-5' exonuclease [Thiospirochaeta perfilievii]QEN06228.1 3'-5' exonuclease [Thiospirochaeta perfilievii]